MKDLCQVCKNFSICGFGSGKKLRPSIKFGKKENEEKMDWIIIDCDLFWEYPRKEVKHG